MRSVKHGICPIAESIMTDSAEIRRFFPDSGCLPSWMCDVHGMTTHEEHLVVFITVQNLVRTDAVVLIICKL